MRAGLTTGGAEAPAMGPRGCGRPVRVSHWAARNGPWGRASAHVRFAPIDAIQSTQTASPKRTLVRWPTTPELDGKRSFRPLQFQVRFEV